MTEFCECEQFADHRKEICRNERDDLPLNGEHSVNAYRVFWGFDPISTEAEPWNVSQPARGLGDIVAKFTHVTGISRAVHAVSTITGVDCGCGGRQDALNKAIPFNKGA